MDYSQKVVKLEWFLKHRYWKNKTTLSFGQWVKYKSLEYNYVLYAILLYFYSKNLLLA